MATFNTIDADGFANAIDGIDLSTGNPISIDIDKQPLKKNSYEWRAKGLWQFPIVGIIHHVSSGCGELKSTADRDGLWDILDKRDLSVHFGIDRVGRIAQFLSLERQARHAERADRNWFGIEHIGSIRCNQTKAQLRVSVYLASAIINWVADEDKGGIPLLHSSGRPPTHGLADHKQGGVLWGDHIDGMSYAPAPTWDWDKYIGLLREIHDI